jgi:hypothetical protein
MDNEIEFLPIKDMDEWETFWADNGEHLGMDREKAFTLASNQMLIVGGGAAPLYRVGFVDEE